MDEPDWLRRNRENWDGRTAVHAASTFYDLPGFVSGRSTLRGFEIDELGDVAGRRLLHLQCHLGLDTLSWARRGATVTGLDLSAAAIEVARDLAGRIGLAGRADFVVSDVYAATDTLAGRRFDLVYTGLGALVWLPDLPRWAATVAALLVEGGSLYLAEFHPLTDALADDGDRLAFDYFDTAATVYDNGHTYTDGPALADTVSVQWRHPLGDVISALAGAGLRVDFLHEHDHTLFQRFTGLERSPDGAFRFPAGSPRIPLMYSLRATRSR
jgi:SAM-dependent methyltransferase